MKRVLVRKPGGHEALELVEEADPPVPAGHVRVRVRACGVNYADVIVRMGRYEAAKGRYPITPGFEFAGAVDAVGSGAARFKPGDRVLGITRFGGYASALSVPENQLYPCPDGWGFADCAGFPAVYLTAYYGMFKAAHVERGETLLVHSAAGGVGTALLRLARIAGCRCVAVVGAPHKRELCRQLGAAAVIDRSAQDLWKEADRLAPEGFDAIFDANGYSTPRPGFDRLKLGGRLVVYGFAEVLPRGRAMPDIRSMVRFLRIPKFSPWEMTAANRAVMGFNVIFLFHKAELAAEAMQTLLGWVREGKIDKTPVTTFPLERAADAHRAIESGTTVGKLVLTV